MESHMSRFRVPLSAKKLIPQAARGSISDSPTSIASAPNNHKTCVTCSCSYSAPNSSEDLAALRARLAWVEGLLDKADILADDLRIENIPTGTSFSKIVKRSPLISRVSGADDPDGAHEKRTLSQVDNDTSDDHTISPDVDNHEPPVKRPRMENSDVIDNASEVTPTFSNPLTNLDVGLLVDSYFRNVHRTYPFAHRARVSATLQRKGDSIFEIDLLDADAMITYLILAIGHAALQREESDDPNPKTIFNISYKDIFAVYLAQESIDSVQILLLLAIYSQFDPNGCTVWPIVDILCCKAVRLGLTQRTTADESCLPDEAERRRRLFWSIYVWDRIVAFSTGIPVALNDANMDIPLPGITVDEFASTDRIEHTSVLQVSRHIIQLRVLEDKVISQIHLRNRKEIRNLTQADRRSIVNDLRTEIEDWYSNGCLLKSTGPEDAMLHIRISWLASRYYNLLLLLYYPSHFNPSESLISRKELVGFAQKHIQATSVRLQQKHLPLNQLTLSRLIPVCMIFLHVFLSYSAEDGEFPAREEITICANIMSSFPKNWKVAHRAADILRQLASLVATSSTYDSAPFSVSTPPTLTPADRAWRHALEVSFNEVAEQIIGKGSAFARWDYLEGNLGFQNFETIPSGITFNAGVDSLTRAAAYEAHSSDSNISPQIPGDGQNLQLEGLDIYPGVVSMLDFS